ncbi:MAG: hypothetical protein HPZ84_15695 [Desulfovibrionaceae bacterium]|nr:hypothetical protein [Desulfovibrionaceae bacterium]
MAVLSQQYAEKHMLFFHFPLVGSMIGDFIDHFFGISRKKHQPFSMAQPSEKFQSNNQ